MGRPLLYVAYPMRLDLGAANALQTYSTMRELRKIVPGARLVVPRWLQEPSAFSSLNALHLPRPAVNKLSKFVPWAGWSYIERTLYSMMLVLVLLAWRITRRSYRVLYVRDAVCAAWLSLLAPLHGSKVIYEVHDLEADHPSRAARWPRGLWARFLPWVDNTALFHSCRVVSLTGVFRDWLAAQGRAASDIAVIPDAFDPALYPPADRTGARTELGLPADAFLVGYAGLTWAYRRLDLLVEAFAKIAPQADNINLLLVGGRPAEQTEVRTQARRLGLEPKVILPGAVEHSEAARYLQASDVLAIPDTVTQMTASPLKLFEYMAAEKPIVLKDMPALREILDDGSAAFFPEGDADALAAVLLRLYYEPEWAAGLAAAAREKSAQYTYAGRAKKILEVAKSCR